MLVIYIYIIESNPTGSIFWTQNKWWFFFTLYDLLAFDWIMTIFHPQNGNESMMPHMHWSFSASKKHPPRPLCLYLCMCVPDLLSAKKIHLFQLLGKKHVVPVASHVSLWRESTASGRGGWDVHVPHCLRGSHAHGCRVQAGSTWETSTQLQLIMEGSNGEQPVELFRNGHIHGDRTYLW